MPKSNFLKNLSQDKKQLLAVLVTVAFGMLILFIIIFLNTTGQDSDSDTQTTNSTNISETNNTSNSNNNSSFQAKDFYENLGEQEVYASRILKTDTRKNIWTISTTNNLLKNGEEIITGETFPNLTGFNIYGQEIIINDGERSVVYDTANQIFAAYPNYIEMLKSRLDPNNSTDQSYIWLEKTDNLEPENNNSPTPGSTTTNTQNPSTNLNDQPESEVLIKYSSTLTSPANLEESADSITQENQNTEESDGSENTSSNLTETSTENPNNTIVIQTLPADIQDKTLKFYSNNQGLHLMVFGEDNYTGNFQLWTFNTIEQKFIRQYNFNNLHTFKTEEEGILLTFVSQEADPNGYFYSTRFIDLRNSSNGQIYTINPGATLKDRNLLGNILANTCTIQNNLLYCPVKKNNTTRNDNSADGVVTINFANNNIEFKYLDLGLSISNLHYLDNDLYFIRQNDRFIYKFVQ